jgi:hypoxanthine phosphoribosyltransferase
LSFIKRFVKRHKRLLSIAQKGKGILHPQRKDWHVISFEDVFGLAVDWTDMLPKDFDCIIGVPRTGLLVANVLSSKMNKPLSTADDFVRGIVWYSQASKTPTVFKKVLVVEDAVNSAKAMKADVEKLKRYDSSMEIKTGCLFVSNQEMKDFIDYYYATTCNAPAEWHMHSFFKNTKLAVDLDGVICDEKSNNPLLIPAFDVEAIITARLENERSDTEAWLKRHGVGYKQLIMFQGLAVDRTFRNIADYKAKAILQMGAEWFWESDYDLAEEVCYLLKIPVYCPTNRTIYSSKSRWLLSFGKRHSKKPKIENVKLPLPAH